MEIDRIGIVGLGLIGGSIGLTLQNKGYEVSGLVNKSKTAERAKERGLAQMISTNSNILSNCSMVILAIPLEQLINPTSELVNALPKNAVITDVGSVKKPVLEIWQKLHPRFVGSHPMAGTIQTGVEAGQTHLFKNRPWIATPEETTDVEALDAVHQLAITLEGQWITTDPQTHDQAVALISHLPVFISTALLQTVTKEPNKSLLMLAKTIASSGFRDTTRVGGGNPELGVAMASNNTSALLNAITSYRSSLDKLEEMIHAKEWDHLKNELSESQLSRPDFL